MEREGISFDETLGDARRLGYVEADEALDLDGIDAAHKAVILAFLAHGKWVKLEEMVCEGIREITTADIEMAGQLGYKIKLLGMIARDFDRNKLSVRLHPALISKEEVIAGVDEVYNGVSVTGDVVGTTLLIGREPDKMRHLVRLSAISRMQWPCFRVLPLPRFQRRMRRPIKRSQVISR